MSSTSPHLPDLRQKLLSKCATGKCDAESYEFAKQLLNTEVDVSYFIVNLKRYIRLNQHQNNFLNIMIVAMYFLSKYASNLLNAGDNTIWRTIHLSNKVFQEKVYPMHGATQILSFMGYTESTSGSMKFPSNVLLPDYSKVAKILMDLIVGMVELKQLVDYPNPDLLTNQTKSKESVSANKSKEGVPNESHQNSSVTQKNQSVASTQCLSKPPVLATAQSIQDKLIMEKLRAAFVDLLHMDERIDVGLKLINFGYSDEIAITAAKSCTDIQSALDFLDRQCVICFDTFPANEVLNFSVCRHEFCKDCLSKFIESTVKENSILKLNCPVCQMPDLSMASGEYFSVVDQMVRNLVKDGYLAKEIYELYDMKLRDYNLHQDPLFLWCPHCSNGFERDPFSPLKVQCNLCLKFTCYKCRIKWNKLHDDVNCEDYRKRLSEKKNEEELLSILNDLEKTGLQCPSCNCKFEHAKGGCMHMTCSNCTFQFCCGCEHQFYENSKSCQFLNCRIDGLHAHHPRNCLYYLRDWSVDRLQKLLRENNKEFDTSMPSDHDGRCHIIELKEKEDSATIETEERECNREAPVGYRGVCMKHFKEYLDGRGHN
ncbi:uncharacterized protein TRIADDRAFT_52519 [Trichoplax adhaerens]|uniref:RBR-type E3 ubiquitin transferase n=1 Tax=Trichoplax adhaerens TaxID=10228 RepID=B3RJ02_TRIAD|nr:hypothetical protein TRIADDRAFT_52519 [Trichoplax adhaerens]EDV29037.1 hypothetical protein TRIADDRAFT_52519 [Trichoplax adhaerens]|eukprot:XP_002108239.1 hypothetical protein TRIADDRAFT_52519 [Trichoplax adhaerens]